MKSRTFNTLFMLSSLDGKISTGDLDTRDVDKDFPKIRGIREGLNQYYELEKKTDLHSFNTGRVMAKVGWNKAKKNVGKSPVSFIIIDNKPHLTRVGVHNLLRKVKVLYLVTTNRKHPAFRFTDRENLKIIYYPRRVDFVNLFHMLRKDFNIRKITVQSGGTLNAGLLRKGLIDEVSIVVAPALIGGKDTSSLVDGRSLRSEKDLKKIRALKLKKCDVLNNSYLHLVYRVLN